MAHMKRNLNLSDRAKDLRKNMTKQEKHLWYDFLSKHEVRWYKQRIIDNYIVDFYCSRAKLVIELDGSQHYTKDGTEYDNERTNVLREYGIEVIRFSNNEIDTCFDGVCLKIEEIVKKRLSDFNQSVKVVAPSGSKADSSP
ncbi:MAG: endonuclease domain-containing protein [Oscillospiraceae bacterium]|nr:endonuclease domain-containing protein [Oscillospiraceae bacterium]